MKDPEKLQTYVHSVATPEGRMVGTAGHDRARDYLLARLTDLNLQPYRDGSFELCYESADGKHFSNLAAVVPGKDRGRKPILIGAHYDSVIPSYCADDNAAAVAIALLAAENLQRLGLGRDTVIALFDAEEPPYFHGDDMGSTRFYREQSLPDGFHLALIMDLVGHDVELPMGPPALRSAAANLLFMTGAESHEALPGVVKHCLPGPQLPLIASLNRNIGDMSDHHVFRLNSVPYLFLSCGRWQHYHEETDTPDRLNYQKMTHICDFVVRLCQALAGTELPQDKRALTPQCIDNGVIDTASLEIELMNRAFGPALPGFLTMAGVETLSSRHDLDELAARLQGFFSL